MSGSFGGLQTFLQRMEALELLGESSDHSLHSRFSKQMKAELSLKRSVTRLTLQLSFYDSVPESANRAIAAGSNEEPV